MSKNQSEGLLPIKGVRLQNLTFEFKALGDFLYWEGPLLSHLVNQYDEDFLFQWCGKDETFNRWLLYKTNYDLLHRYFRGDLTDLDLLLANPDGFVYIVDVDHDVNWRQIFVVAFDDIPKNYLPNAAVNYDPGDFEPYTEKLRAYLDLHFARQRSIYKPSDAPAAFAAEPPPPGYGK